jgi:hypothetical protein
MAIEFDLMPSGKVEITNLRQETQHIIQELLNLSFQPDIRIKEWDSDHTLIVGETYDNFTFELDGLGEASLAFFYVPIDEASPNQKVLAAVVSAGGYRSEVSTILALAVAIALGRKTGSQITDDALLFSDESQVNPNELLHTIQLREEQHDLQNASHKLLKKRKLV